MMTHYNITQNKKNPCFSVLILWRSVNGPFSEAAFPSLAEVAQHQNTLHCPRDCGTLKYVLLSAILSPVNQEYRNNDESLNMKGNHNIIIKLSCPGLSITFYKLLKM